VKQWREGRINDLSKWDEKALSVITCGWGGKEDYIIERPDLAGGRSYHPWDISTLEGSNLVGGGGGWGAFKVDGGNGFVPSEEKGGNHDRSLGKEVTPIKKRFSPPTYVGLRDAEAT